MLRTAGLLGLALLFAVAAGIHFDVMGHARSWLEAEIGRRFQYPPPEPGPVEAEDPAEGQRLDAAYLEAFPDYDRALGPQERDAAKVLAAKLAEDAPRLTHEEFVLRVLEMTALADNGHSGVGSAALKKNTPRLPLRLYPFAEGLFVLQAGPDHAHLLGARILRIDGRDIEAIWAALESYAGGTKTYRRNYLLPILESPAFLKAAGLADDGSSLTYQGVLRDGAPFETRIAAEIRGRDAPISSTMRTIFPRARSEGTGLTGFLEPSTDDPPYLRDSKRLFLLADLPEGGLYARLTHNADGDDEPIGPFLASVLERAAGGPAYFVLDMRFNGGGDYTMTYYFATRLPAALGPETPLYILTSPWTFSAAITTVARVKQIGAARAKIVGEEVGDRLSFWAEGGAFDLPNSFIRVHYSAGRHEYAQGCWDLSECFWVNYIYPVRVKTLRPDIAAPLTFSAYRERRDPAIEAVMADMAVGSR